MARRDSEDTSRRDSRSLSPCLAPAPESPNPDVPAGAAPAVSVIITAYNPGEFLHDAIGSVIAQTFTDWELVIVDDGSDEDLAWVRSVDPRASLVRQRNQGVSVARNHGIAVTRGRFIAFLDHDDRWRPTKLERQVELLRTGSVFCHTDFDLIDSEGSYIGPGTGGKMSYLDILAGERGVLLSSSIVDRTVLGRVGLFNPAFRRVQDYDLFLRLARSYELSYVPTVEVDYRIHDGHVRPDYWVRMQALRELGRQARLEASRNKTAVTRAIRVGERKFGGKYASMAFDAARHAAKVHRPFSAARHLARATRLSPKIMAQRCAAVARTRIVSLRWQTVAIPTCQRRL